VQNQTSDEKALLIKLYQEVAAFYTKTLWSPEGEKAREYILARGLSEETLKTWGIGYSLEPREMFESMKKKGFSEKLLLESGIFISGYKDRFFGRLIFPIRNYR
jgi:DNA primase